MVAEVVNVNATCTASQAEVVGLAMRNAALHANRREPHRETLRVVVGGPFSLVPSARACGETRRPDHQSVSSRPRARRSSSKPAMGAVGGVFVCPLEVAVRSPTWNPPVGVATTAQNRTRDSTQFPARQRHCRPNVSVSFRRRRSGAALGPFIRRSNARDACIGIRYANSNDSIRARQPAVSVRAVP